MKKIILLGLFTVLLFSLAPTVEADRGMIPVDPNVSVREPGQKAIIGWNGVEEGLILSTNVSADKKTKIVEMIPLPSEPEKVEEASFESFEIVQSLILRHGLKLVERAGKGEYGGETDSPEIVLHKKIGPHEITVAKAGDKEELVRWLGEYLAEQGVEEQIPIRDFESVIQDYLNRDFNYWVIDMIEVEESKSVTPIYYEFDSDFLYYPLEITRPVGGSGTVNLFLLTNEEIKEDTFPLEKAQYRLPDEESQPIEFRVSTDELERIDKRVADLFAFENGAHLTALKYDGSLAGFDRDITLLDQGESTEPYSPEINFDPQINIQLNEFALILAILIALLVGIGAFLGTFLAIKSRFRL
ncbi:hypothetical protein AKJ36_03375 [candidate division MSBL1 archaeon SCGC-AAA259I07]|uniref:DUF2330 domain-containing protein n=2 Tax=candidate division MSBL1 TaxID=215777 RepID=A0A133U8V4_9EURY|nr:hypothetical protein AKJ61_00250 [candidate division MSBL1 archaeon SCGC-AAA259B11]KXA94158.1 hypothetical protein AKJ36_03375 [candidate division MSBL1 archaeon SCGC-AAA259I07]